VCSATEADSRDWTTLGRGTRLTVWTAVSRWNGQLIMAKVEVYSSMFCGFCYRAKKLLEKKGVAFTEINVMANPARRAEMVQRSGGRTSVPQIFIDDQWIGGCDELYALESSNKLDPLLQPAT